MECAQGNAVMDSVCKLRMRVCQKIVPQGRDTLLLYSKFLFLSMVVGVTLLYGKKHVHFEVHMI